MALAGLVAPQFATRWIELDIFSHFRLHFIGVAVVSLLAMRLKRAWLAVLVVGVCATPFVITATASFMQEQASLDEAAKGDIRLKVLTYNTWFRNDDWPALETYLRKEDADIVVMMEYGPSKRPMLDKLKDLYPYQRDCISVTHCFLVLLSKTPFEKAGHKTGWKGPPIIWAKFGDEFSGLTVIGAHLSRPPFAKFQLRQMQMLSGEVLKRGGPVIVAGDFNATRWSHMLDAFEAGSGLQRLTGAPTWPTFFFGFPQLGIDHIFVSRGIRLLSSPHRGEDVGSDHLPISATLAVPTN